MSVSNSGYEVALKINAVLTRIQAELKCGVCRSTFSNPVAANCGHTFCEDCVNQVFERRRFVECPLCRERMNKRSCTTSEQLDALVKGYLQLGKVFRTEIQTQTISIPQELAYMESQIPAAPISDSPLRDFRPPEPHFALPKARARRKQPLSVHNLKQQKMDTISEESEAKENVDMPKAKETENNEVHPVKKSILARRSETDLLRYARSKTVEVQCDFPNPSCVCRNLRGALASFKDINQKSDYPSDLHALFAMVPEYKQILEENLPTLYELLPFPQSTNPDVACVIPRAENCEIAASAKIDLDAVSGDVCEDDLCETQPSPFALEADSKERVKTALQNVEEMLPCCSRSSSGVVPQSSTDDDDEDEMEITLQGNFESFPVEIEACKVGPTDIAAEVLSPMFVSVSRMSCIEDERLLQEFLALFSNVHYSEELTAETTHLVMMNSQQPCERRSLRYVYAVARKCEILSRRWLEECLELKRLLPTEKYALPSQSSETPGWLRAKTSTKQLFEKTKFFLPQSFSESKHLPRESLKELISLCGGDCCEKPWEVAGAHKAYTIFKPKSSNWNEAQRYEASMQGVPVLVADWVLDSIAEFRLMPTDAYKVRHR